MLFESGELAKATIYIDKESEPIFINDTSGNLTIGACLTQSTIDRLKVREGEAFLTETITLEFRKSPA